MANQVDFVLDLLKGVFFAVLFSYFAPIMYCGVGIALLLFIGSMYGRVFDSLWMIGIFTVLTVFVLIGILEKLAREVLSGTALGQWIAAGLIYLYLSYKFGTFSILDEYVFPLLYRLG